MTDLEYINLCGALFDHVENQCDHINEHFGIDLDNIRSSSALTLTFGQGKQIVITLQKPLHQVWLATHLGGLHFHFDQGVWRDTKTGEEFFSTLTHHASEIAGQTLTFDAKQG